MRGIIFPLNERYSQPWERSKPSKLQETWRTCSFLMLPLKIIQNPILMFWITMHWYLLILFPNTKFFWQINCPCVNPLLRVGPWSSVEEISQTVKELSKRRCCATVLSSCSGEGLLVFVVLQHNIPVRFVSPCPCKVYMSLLLVDEPPSFFQSISLPPSVVLQSLHRIENLVLGQQSNWNEPTLIAI